MAQKRIYECSPNASTGRTEIKLTDEEGNLINKSSFDSLEIASCYFQEIKDELAMNRQLEIIQTDSFHFEYKKLKQH